MKLCVNFFELTVPEATVFHQYDVTIKDITNMDRPRVDFLPKSKGREVIEEVVNKYKRDFRQRPVYDGKKIMCTRRPLAHEGAVSC